MYVIYLLIVVAGLYLLYRLVPAEVVEAIRSTYGGDGAASI
jgi:hypothetical protein